MRLSALILAIPLAFLSIAVPASNARADLVTYDKGDLTVDTAKGPLHFSIEIAKTEPEREQGLMYRPSMAADAGMLFLYDQPQQAAFWMKNTLIPLDMLFIAADGHIVNIAKRAVPMSETTIFSTGPVSAIVEINGGAADRFDIQPGDRVHGPGLP
jgi:uncharacterized membrane protein (UPF0127 family)